MTVITGLFMCALVGTISIASDIIGLALLIATVSAIATVLSLIKITHPAAPPYSVSLLFYQVRTRLGLPKALTSIIPVLRGKQNARVYLIRGAI